jgi:beta-glucosidase
MTDDERFSLLISVMGANKLLPVRGERIPGDVPMSAGYVPGMPRLGVPAGVALATSFNRSSRVPRARRSGVKPAAGIQRGPGGRDQSRP